MKEKCINVSKSLVWFIRPYQCASYSLFFLLEKITNTHIRPIPKPPIPPPLNCIILLEKSRPC